MFRNILSVSSVFLIVVSTQVFGQSMTEQPILLGKANYNANCADCHGADAKGDGPYAKYLTIKPKDLTALAKDASGVFPFSELYQLIDGTTAVRTHKISSMPVWGEEFMADTLVDHGMAREDADSIVQGRILSLVYYLQTIQQ